MLGRMDENMIRVAALPLDIVEYSPAENMDAVGKTLEALSGDIDLAVLPELFTTSFVKDPEQIRKLAEPDDGATISAVREMASAHATAIAGSFLAVDGDRYYNRAFFAKPDGSVVFYDKRHLFALSAEREVYSAGEKRLPIVAYKGWNIAMMVCYDLRFPVWSRNVGNAYDMLLVPANWPTSRGYAWTHLLIARAIENQAVVVGADRGGCDEYGCYDGLSMIYDAMGQPVGHPAGASHAVVAELSLAEVRKIRRRMPVFESADRWEICD